MTFRFSLPIPGSSEETMVTRCYSLSDSSNPNYYRVSIRKVLPMPDSNQPPGQVSNYFHNQVHVGDIIEALPASGGFHLNTQETKKPAVLIAGGIGITPMLSMLNHIVENNIERDVWLFYGARNKADLIQVSHLTKLRQKYSNVHVHFCLSHEKEENLAAGYLKEPISIALFDKLLPSNDCEFYLCGPPPMMQGLIPALREWKVPEPQLFYEAFGPASFSNTKKDPEEVPEKALIEFVDSQQELPWHKNEGTVLDVALKNNVQIQYGCKVGNCHSCVVGIVSGEVSYLRSPSQMPEQGKCLACISIPKKDLKIAA